MARPQTLATVGRNVDRKEGEDKLTGRAHYVDDLSLPNMIYGATVRSTVPRARIVEIDRDPAFDWTGFVVVTARDIESMPERKNVVAMITEDQPFLARDEVRHQAEPILLLAHADRARLADGCRHVRVHYAPEPAVLSLDDATEVFKEIRIVKGNAKEALAGAEVIVEGEYRTAAQEQLYIECNGVIATPDRLGDPTGLTVIGSLQCPYYVSRALEQLFGLSRSQIRVVQATTGGGFGGKEEYPSMLAGHAALLAKKAGVPVKMMYERHEDLVATTKRHASLIRHRTGLRKDGTLVGVEVDLRLDAGAYVTLSPVVLSRASIHAVGPYRYDHVLIHGRAMRTDTPPAGAFRGFGAPQAQFAVEAHMDRIAATLGLDAIELRRKNLLRPGDSTATGQTLTESVSAAEVLDRALARHAATGRKAAAKSNAKSKTKPKAKTNSRSDGLLRGTGVALFYHGSGFTGGGETKLASKAGLELTKNGVRLLVGSTEIGQGTRTMHAQIVAETLGLPYDLIETLDPDTAVVPDSGPTVASRTCMVVGGILQRAARRLAAELGEYKDGDDFRRLARRHLKATGPLKIIEEYQRPAEIVWSDETYLGDAYGAFAWGCNIADVEIDPVTYQARCTRLVAVIDIGKAIHPILVEGQIEGGSLQAIGWALYEDVVMKNGVMANASLTNYIIPTTLDTPQIDVVLVENPYKNGPFGAKGVGECPTDGPAAAVVNAIANAIGHRVDEIPVTPERLMKLMTQRSS